jgi:hypothetical protein
VALPAISMGNAEYWNPMVKIPIPGDHIEYEPLRLEFLVDEDMKNYIELHSWIRGLGFPEDPAEFKELYDATKASGIGEGITSEASLLIGTNLKNPNIEVTFQDAFPISLGELNFTTTDTDVNYITCTATFKYTLFQIKALPR